MNTFLYNLTIITSITRHYSIPSDQSLLPVFVCWTWQLEHSRSEWIHWKLLVEHLGRVLWSPRYVWYVQRRWMYDLGYQSVWNGMVYVYIYIMSIRWGKVMKCDARLIPPEQGSWWFQEARRWNTSKHLLLHTRESFPKSRWVHLIQTSLWHPYKQIWAREAVTSSMSMKIISYKVDDSYGRLKDGGGGTW
jgi:hypothetical protein